MARYIDADEFKRNINASFEDVKNRIDAELGEKVRRFVNDCIDIMPAADIRPVTHGHWIPLFENDYDQQRGVAMNYECSECGGRVRDDTYSHALDYELCPRCGAVMDGKDGESNV